MNKVLLPIILLLALGVVGCSSDYDKCHKDRTAYYLSDGYSKVDARGLAAYQCAKVAR